MSIAERTIPARPARTSRVDRDKAIQPKNLGNMTVYTFKDVLDYAYDMGFVRFGQPFVEFTTTYDMQGKPMTTTSVLIPAIFLEMMSDGTFEEVEHWGFGDANYENCGNKKVGVHYPRMADTRARGRALAHALNLDANFAEEMGGSDDESPRPAPRTSNSRPTSGKPSSITEADYPPSNDGDGGWICEETGVPVTGKNAYWSQRKYGRILCWDEQEKLKNG